MSTNSCILAHCANVVILEIFYLLCYFNIVIFLEAIFTWQDKHFFGLFFYTLHFPSWHLVWGIPVNTMGIGVNASNLSQLKVFSPSSSMNEKTDNCVSTRKEVVRRKQTRCYAN